MLLLCNMLIKLVGYAKKNLCKNLKIGESILYENTIVTEMSLNLNLTSFMKAPIPVTSTTTSAKSKTTGG